MQRVVRRLTEVVGLGQAIAICRRWGGRPLRIPRRVDETHPIALALGLDVANRLVDAFAGEELRLPAERAALTDLRNAEIYRRHRAGESSQALGLDFGLTRQAIDWIVRQMREREAGEARAQGFAGAEGEPAAAESANLKVNRSTQP